MLVAERDVTAAALVSEHAPRDERPAVLTLP